MSALRVKLPRCASILYVSLKLPNGMNVVLNLDFRSDPEISIRTLIEIFVHRIYDLYVPKPGDTVIDVGAHIGLFTLKACSTMGPEGLIIAVEPEPYNLSLLNLNVAINKLNNVVIMPYAAMDYDGYARLYLHDLSTLHSTLYKSNRYINVPCLTLDTMLKHLARIDLLKIDVEGAEVKVLKGASRVLRRTRNVIIEVHENALLEEVRNLLEEKDFNVTVYRHLFQWPLSLKVREMRLTIQVEILRTLAKLLRGQFSTLLPILRSLYYGLCKRPCAIRWIDT